MRKGTRSIIKTLYFKSQCRDLNKSHQENSAVIIGTIHLEERFESDTTRVSPRPCIEINESIVRERLVRLVAK